MNNDLLFCGDLTNLYREDAREGAFFAKLFFFTKLSVVPMPGRGAEKKQFPYSLNSELSGDCRKIIWGRL